jgi:acyl-coenzyme A thioesterase PaaI-like protein
LKASDIPFVKHIGIQENENELSLDFSENVLNHIKTIHASAQFTLAETQSGLYLQSLFPELEGKVVPLLREAQVKYKKPALEKIMAYATADEEEVEKFRASFEKKGRASLSIRVEVKDINDVLTSQANFSWFVQKI